MTITTLTLRYFDIPAIHRFGVGFDSMLDDLARLAASNTNNYPPYNLIKTDDNKFSIEVAVAGFSEGEISITMEKNHLTIKGAKKDGVPENYEYLHRGISQRNFERTFPLAEHIEVKGALIRNGMLIIDLERIIPEEDKPKSIDIQYVK
jgi:molecular chaperone IbpA